METKKITMTDIAIAANVSQATVSVVLNANGDDRITKETKDKVLATAKKLGYNLKRNKKNITNESILCICDDISMTQMAPLLVVGAQKEAKEQNKKFMLLLNELDDKNLEQHIQEISPSGIILTTSITRALHIPSFFEKYQTILLNCLDPDYNYSSILPDEMAGVRVMVTKLIKQGYQRIACIAGEHWMLSSSNRLEGYKQALISEHKKIDHELIFEGNWQMNSGYDSAKKIFALPKEKKVDAICCFSDLVAQGCYLAAFETGLTIPKDIAIIGFDNSDNAYQLTPQLTTIELPHEKMGRIAVQQLLTQAPDSVPVNISVPCRSIMRGSS